MSEAQMTDAAWWTDFDRLWFDLGSAMLGRMANTAHRRKQASKVPAASRARMRFCNKPMDEVFERAVADADQRLAGAMPREMKCTCWPGVTGHLGCELHR